MATLPLIRNHISSIHFFRSRGSVRTDLAFERLDYSKSLFALAHCGGTSAVFGSKGDNPSWLQGTQQSGSVNIFARDPNANTLRGSLGLESQYSGADFYSRASPNWLLPILCEAASQEWEKPAKWILHVLSGEYRPIYQGDMPLSTNMQHTLKQQLALSQAWCS